MIHNFLFGTAIPKLDIHCCIGPVQAQPLCQRESVWAGELRNGGVENQVKDPKMDDTHFKCNECDYESI